MITDSNLEQRSDWEMKVGPDIGGVPPDDYGFLQWPGFMKLWTKGKAFSDWLAALHRPLLPNSGHLSLAFDLMTDINTPQFAQAIEFDTRVSIGGWNYNFSAQVNYVRGGLLQLSDATGKWADTDFRPGKFTAGVWTPVRMVYQFDSSLRVYGTMEAWIGEQRWRSSGKLVLPAQELKWKDSCSLQIQLDISGSASEFAVYIRDARYEWS